MPENILKSKNVRLTALIVLLLLAAFVLWRWLTPRHAPDPRTAPPAQIAEFLSTSAFTRMNEQARYQYILSVLNAHLEPAAQDRLIAGIEKLSDSQIAQVRDSMVQALMTRIQNESRDYALATNPIEKKRFLDQKLAEYLVYKNWADRVKDNPRFRQAVPNWDQRAAFELIVKNTSPSQRFAMECYFHDLVVRYFTQIGQKLPAK